MKTYYMQLKELVLPELKFYKTDLLEIDRKILKNYHGQFLYSHRNSGTDIFKLDYTVKFLESDYKTVINSAYIFLMRENNNVFYHGYKDVVYKINRNKMQKHFYNFINHVSTLKSYVIYNGLDLTTQRKRDLLFKKELKELKGLISC